MKSPGLELAIVLLQSAQINTRGLGRLVREMQTVRTPSKPSHYRAADAKSRTDTGECGRRKPVRDG
jgi:hypothetical protein